MLCYKFCEIFKNTLFSESVKTNKSPGYDELSSNVIKNYFTELNDSLKYLLGNSISGQGEGHALKITRVTPLFKGGDPSNYKPISLLPCFMKILERIIYIYSWVPNRRVGRRVGITEGLNNQCYISMLWLDSEYVSVYWIRSEKTRIQPYFMQGIVIFMKLKSSQRRIRNPVRHLKWNV